MAGGRPLPPQGRATPPRDNRASGRSGTLGGLMWCRWGAGIAARAGERTLGRSGESGKGCCAAIRLAGSSSSHDSVSGHAGWRPWPGLCLQSCGPWVSGPRNRRARSWSAGGMRRQERPCPSPSGARFRWPDSMARLEWTIGPCALAGRTGTAMPKRASHPPPPAPPSGPRSTNGPRPVWQGYRRGDPARACPQGRAASATAGRSSSC